MSPYLKPRGFDVDEVVVDRVMHGSRAEPTSDEILAAFLALNDQSLSAAEIADRLHITPRTVQRWRFRYAPHPGCHRRELLSRWTRCDCARCGELNRRAARKAYHRRGGKRSAIDREAVNAVATGQVALALRPRVDRAEAIRVMLGMGLPYATIAERSGTSYTNIEKHAQRLRRKTR